MKPITFCVLCKHMRKQEYYPYFIPTTPDWVCVKSLVKIDFVSGAEVYNPCYQVNVDGDCPTYEERARVMPKIPLWRRVLRSVIGIIPSWPK